MFMETKNKSAAPLPTSTELGVHHPGGRDGLWRARTDTGQRVDDGDGVANPGGGRLMELQRGGLTLVRGDVGVGVGVEREGRVGSHLVRLRARVG